MRSEHEATFYEKLPDGRVHCQLCPHHCTLSEGRSGICGVRINEGGTLYTLAYDRLAAFALDPIEKKPLFHFLPGTMALSVATVGCNLRCQFCQNWEISQWRPAPKPTAATSWAPPLEVEPDAPGHPIAPKTIVAMACRAGAASIAYTYTEPT